MAIFREEKSKEKPYTVISNKTLGDESITNSARGLLCQLLGKPDNWVFNVKNLVENTKDGRDAIYSDLRELRKNGYIVKRPIRNEKGVIVKWQEFVYETPQEEAKEIYKEQQERREKSALKRAEAIIKKNQLQKELIKEKSIVTNEKVEYVFNSVDKKLSKLDKKIVKQTTPYEEETLINKDNLVHKNNTYDNENICAKIVGNSKEQKDNNSYTEEDIYTETIRDENKCKNNNSCTETTISNKHNCNKTYAEKNIHTETVMGDNPHKTIKKSTYGKAGNGCPPSGNLVNIINNELLSNNILNNNTSSCSSDEDTNIIKELVDNFTRSICELKRTTLPKFINLIKGKDITFIKILIEYCEEINILSFAGFKTVLEKCLLKNILTAEAFIKSINDHRKNKEKKMLNKSMNKNKSKNKTNSLQFTNYEQRTYDYDVLENQLLGWA